MTESAATAPQTAAAAETSAKTYLITGGAGFLGINMVRHLLARGHRVVSLDIADFDYPEQGQITEIKGDIRDKATVSRAMAGVDIVIHTATMRDGRRRVREIAALPGRVESGTVEVAELFTLRNGVLRRGNGFPPHAERFEAAGFDLSALLDAEQLDEAA